MSKIGDKEAAQRAMREARFKKTPAHLAQPKQPDGSIEHPKDRRKREIAEMIDDATTGDFKDGPSFQDIQPGDTVHITHADGSKKTVMVGDKPAREVIDAEEEESRASIAGKVKLTIRIDKELMKEIKIDAVETEQTVEAWVEAAIRQELKARFGGPKR